MEIKKRKMGICPKCGSDYVDYVDYDWDADYLRHRVICRDCDFEFTEFERLIYDGYSYVDENGQWHEYSKEGIEI